MALGVIGCVDYGVVILISGWLQKELKEIRSDTASGVTVEVLGGNLQKMRGSVPGEESIATAQNRSARDLLMRMLQLEKAAAWLLGHVVQAINVNLIILLQDQKTLHMREDFSLWTLI